MVNLNFLAVAANAAENLASRAEPVRPLVERLDPERRAKVVMALVGLVFLGAALVALAWLAARGVRRTICRPFPVSKARADDWAARPLVPPAGAEDDDRPVGPS